MNEPPNDELSAEMLENYPHFRKFVYASLREKFAKTLGELPNKDLQTLIDEEGGMPLEDFIDKLFPPEKQ